MSKMEQISAERRREENIRKNREFQMQIGLTQIAENDLVLPPEKKFHQEYIKRENIESRHRRSRRIKKRFEDERNRNEKCRKVRSSAAITNLKFIAKLANFAMRVPYKYINAIYLT